MRHFGRHGAADSMGKVMSELKMSKLLALHQLYATMEQECRVDRGDTSVVFTRGQATTEHVTKWLNDHGVHATAYHGGMNAYERQHVQQAWANGEIPVLVATGSSFGCGINNPNVRLVVLFDGAQSIEDASQQTGNYLFSLFVITCLLTGISIQAGQVEVVSLLVQ